LTVCTTSCCVAGCDACRWDEQNALLVESHERVIAELVHAAVVSLAVVAAILAGGTSRTRCLLRATSASLLSLLRRLRPSWLRRCWRLRGCARRRRA
jgi:hypothetical protein